jgi:hypothetical protein
MKLTKEQITYIENYIKKNDVKYYEVYMEILDHMILSVEAVLENDKEISFEDAVVQAKNEGFGKKGFRGMMNEKQKLAQKQANKQNNKMIKEYFTFPKIVMTFFIFISYFLFLECFEDPRKANLLCIVAVGFSAVLQIIYFWKYRKISKLTILKTQILSNMFLVSFFGVNINQMIYNLGKETFDFNHILMRLFMTLVFTFSLISLLVYIEIRKQTIEEVKTQIFV